MNKKILLLSLICLGISACSTVTITSNGQSKLVSEPTYEASKPFFFWGLAGEHRIDVLKVCKNKEPIQLQSQQTFTDSAMGILTLGIYAPHTAKVWCPEEKS